MTDTPRDCAHGCARCADARKALDMLAGLHPCLTTDEPMAMAEAIFEAVQSREQEARDEEARHECEILLRGYLTDLSLDGDPSDPQ